MLLRFAQHLDCAGLQLNDRQALLLVMVIALREERNALNYLETGVGLTLIGSTGIGKTHLAVGLLKKAIEVNWSARFIGTVALLDEIGATFDSSRPSQTYQTEQSLIRALTSVRLPVLDDLRLDGLTAWGRDRLYAVLNRRWEHGLPTITTSNYTPGELAHSALRARPGLDDGTLSRLVRAAITLQLEGPDYRLEQKRQAMRRSSSVC